MQFYEVLMKDLGLYIHIPFCKSKCYYCDFCSIKGVNKSKEYLDRLVDENDKIASKLQAYKIKTVYVGGGTPSYVDENDLYYAVNSILSKYEKDIKEFTIEINPDSITENKLKIYKKLGVNRVSIGVQTLNDDILKLLNRPHTASEAVSAVKLAKEYFDNVSVDLMIGLPNQTKEDCKLAIETAYSLGVNHISCYTLQLEDNTALKKMVDSGKIILPTDDQTADLYDYCYDALIKHGYDRYEISNFCLADKVSLHNYAYWDRVNYLGLGASSHSLIGNYRFNNTNNISKYINGASYENVEKLDKDDEEFETIMLSLRTKKGIDLIRYEKSYGVNFFEKYRKQLDKLKNYLDITENFVKIKEKYYEVSNEIIVEFMDI